jgi:hypothetical protein
MVRVAQGRRQQAANPAESANHTSEDYSKRGGAVSPGDLPGAGPDGASQGPGGELTASSSFR